MDAVEFSAKMPRYIDFEGIWVDILARFDDPNCWNEPHMAAYLRMQVLDEDDDGVFRCQWRSGMDSVMAGYRAYASNTIERQWRTIKGLLGNYATFDSSQIIVRVCEIFRALATQANLRDLRLRIDDPLDRLFNDPSPPSSERLSNGSQPRLLTVARILDYLRQHSPGDVYIHEEVDWRVVVNHVEKRASDILVIPKYQLRFGTEQRQLMEQVLQILAAQERATWLLAFSGDYSLDHHRKLFERFTAVYRFTDGTFFAIHKDFLSQQQTSHYHFFAAFGIPRNYNVPLRVPNPVGLRGSRSVLGGTKISRRSWVSRFRTQCLCRLLCHRWRLMAPLMLGQILAMRTAMKTVVSTLTLLSSSQFPAVTPLRSS